MGDHPAIDLRAARDALRTRLLAEWQPDAGLTGTLSASALATAVALVALEHIDGEAGADAVARARTWLATHANPDGGWGDSPESPSNLSTTLLAWAALGADTTPAGRRAAATAHGWLAGRLGADPTPERVATAVLRHYGNDRTFSAPILVFCALAGRLGPAPVCWRHVPQLPFELAAAPQTLFRWLGLPVVSYAVPALIAIGLVRHRHAPTAHPLRRALRHALTGRCLRVLERIQPATGGFLEAAPLTGFVTLSLAACGLHTHPVTQAGARFLAAGQRPDGSWPIDTDLATWVTTLAVNALGHTGLGRECAARTRDPLLQRQQRTRHPFTGAAPGGWGWTGRAGAVPDADDTAGALLALHRLAPADTAVAAAAAAGLDWLLALQNGDGGFPTFCRGWGRLPFDRSCPDLTAHALRAFAAWRSLQPPRRRRRLDRAACQAVAYLAVQRRPDGSWLPLWFGSQRNTADGQHNPLYGTVQVTLGLRAALPALPDTARPTAAAMLEGGEAWLRAAQGADGGWGAAAGVPATIEETALALAALPTATDSATAAAVARGFAWLAAATGGFRDFPAAPIGLYFASLWYSERLYPVVWTAAALERHAAQG